MGAPTVLILGSGGREHALARALARSPQAPRVIVAPGNDGMIEAERRPLAAMEDAAALAGEIGADLVVIGPEAPLVAGVADDLRAAGFATLGPGREAARLEGSKRFMKDVADTAGIPTARHAAFEDEAAALAHLERDGAPIVVKADGLASGKGVTVAETADEAARAIRECFAGRFGAAGARVVLEERLEGPEISAFVLCDAEGAVRYLGDAQDHKRLRDGDAGPNTGGMGAVSPSPLMDEARRAEVIDRFVRPTLAEMARRGAPFQGILFCGLMLTDAGLKLLEFNTRFGDPEAQVLLPRLEADPLTLFTAAARGTLADVPDAGLAPTHVCGVVMAAPGYPDAPRPGDAIGGLDAEGRLPGHDVIHAATTYEDGVWRAAGGRVLTVLGRGSDAEIARKAAYAGVARLDWPQAQWRHDVGASMNRKG